MGVELVQGIAADTQAEAMEVFWESFRGKMHRVLGDDERARQFWAAALTDVGTTLALDSETGRPLGLMSASDREHPATSNEWPAAKDAYGALQAFGRLMLLAQMNHKPKPGELYIEFLAVHSSARGRGVGGLMLQRADEIARERGLDRVTLEVIDTNPRARALYERSGFWVEATKSMGPTRRLFGFDRYHAMVRPLPDR